MVSYTISFSGSTLQRATLLSPSSLASQVVISSWVDTCPVTPLPCEDHPSTQACQTGLINT